MADNKTEEPTPRQRERVRQQGRVARSQELTMSLTFIVSVLLVFRAGQTLVGQLAGLMRRSFSQPDADVTLSFLTTGVVAVIGQMGPALVVPFIGVAAVAVLAALAQGGYVPSKQPFRPNVDAVSPISGIKRMFSRQSLVMLLKSLAKVAIVSLLAYTTLSGLLPRLALVSEADFRQTVNSLTQAINKLALQTAAALVVVGVLDYVWERRRFEGSIKMTRHEVIEDLKAAEGSQQMKARIRQLQRQFARQRMMEAVPTADAIVTNPTHLAVAIKYDRKAMAAPVIVAKGKGKVAEQIMKKAREHGVPLVQNIPLAHALIKFEIGTAIPAELYQAVAEILVFVYRLRAARAAA